MEGHLQVSQTTTTGRSQQMARRDEGSETPGHPRGRHMGLRHMAGHQCLQEDLAGQGAKPARTPVAGLRSYLTGYGEGQGQDQESEW